MEILFCSHEQFYPLSGGGSIGSLELVKSLVKRGHTVTVSTPLFVDREEVEDKFGVKIYDFSPFYMHRSANHRLIRYGLYAFLFIGQLIKLMSRKKYHVVIIRNSVLSCCVLLLLPFFRSTKFYLSYTDFLGSFLFEAPRVPKILAWMVFFYEMKVPRFFNGIFVVSPRMKNELINSGIPEKQIYVVYDGVNIQEMDPLQVNPDDINKLRDVYRLKGKKVVIFHGTIEPHHGTAIIAEIVNKTLKQNDNIAFLIVGVGRDYHKLKNEISHPDVHFPGFISGYELITYLAAADIGIIPYQRSYGLDMVYTLKLLEYFAMNLSVVSYDHLTIKETFSEYPFIKLAHSTDEFVQDIIELLESDFSYHPREIIEQKFTWENVADRIETVISGT